MGTDHRHETLIRETYRAPRQDPPFAMTKMVTRCPQCGTSFRITAAQLQTARGAVRCGACLHIFRAQEHLVGSSAPEAPRSEEHTSELQSRGHLVCRLLLEKKKNEGTTGSTER